MPHKKLFFIFLVLLSNWGFAQNNAWRHSGNQSQICTVVTNRNNEWKVFSVANHTDMVNGINENGFVLSEYNDKGRFTSVRLFTLPNSSEEIRVLDICHEPTMLSPTNNAEVFYVTGVSHFNGGQRMFVTQIDAAGAVLWYNENLSAYTGNALVALPNGGCIAVGTSTQGGVAAVTATQFDPQGNIIWDVIHADNTINPISLYPTEACFGNISGSETGIAITGRANNTNTSSSFVLTLDEKQGQVNLSQLYSIPNFYSEGGMSIVQNIDNNGFAFITNESTSILNIFANFINIDFSGVILDNQRYALSNSFLKGYDIKHSQMADEYIIEGVKKISGDGFLVGNNTILMETNKRGIPKWAQEYNNTIDNGIKNNVSLINMNGYFITSNNAAGGFGSDIFGIRTNYQGLSCENHSITHNDFSPNVQNSPLSLSTTTNPNWIFEHDLTPSLFPASDDYCNCTAEVTGKLLLQHATLDVNTNEWLMNDYYRSLSPNGLPLSDPYATYPYFANGNTHYAAPQLPASALSIAGNDAIVDWIVIELREEDPTHLGMTPTKTRPVHSRAALLQKDGDIVDIGGGPVHFNKTFCQPYYIAIYHRNHLPFRTLNAMLLSKNSNAPTNLNFTDGSVPLENTSTTAFETLSLSPIVQSMVGGDCATPIGTSAVQMPDGSVDAFDTIIWEIQNGLFDDYNLNSDYNFDGSVDAFDTIIWELNNGKFNTVE